MQFESEKKTKIGNIFCANFVFIVATFALVTELRAIYSSFNSD